MFNFTKFSLFVRRNYSSAKNLKKFYKNVLIGSENVNEYQIFLDSRALKTPHGNPFIINSESLAQAIAHEWDSQHDTIKRYSMHLTNLCNTAIDNPTGRNPNIIVKGLLEYLDSDTICFRCTEPDELHEMQCAFWNPVLEYIEQRYNVTPVITDGIVLPKLPQESRRIFERHLLANNNFSLTGFQHCIETLKSVYLAIALADNMLSVEQAVRLSRLEYEHQINKWGNIPWYHEVETAEMETRVASSAFLIYTGQNFHNATPDERK